MTRTRVALAALALAPLAGCAGEQSALAPTGLEAERIAQLFWIMTIGGAVILVMVIALTAIAMLGSARWRARLGRDGLIIGGGIVFPFVVLSALLVYGLVLTGSEASPTAQAEPMRVTVVGERWWWRVIYEDGDGRRFESANELRIPVERPVEVSLLTADVIHSFWVPKLAGKLDMIPGRKNVLRLVAHQPGISRGQCAEYCGGAHALMAFYVVAVPEDEYAAWLREAAGPAAAPSKPEAVRGQALFMASGCGGCHTVRGSAARGTIGPDLTTYGARRSIAAGTLPNTPDDTARWIAHNQTIKPENLMPPYGIFDATELRALAAYLHSLR